MLLQPAAEQKQEAAENAAMVSLREAAKQLGLQVSWNAEIQTVVLSKDGYRATISVGSAKYGYTKLVEKDGDLTEMTVEALAAQAPELRDGRTYVPQSMIDALKQQMQ